MTLDALVAEASEVELLAQSWAYHSANWGSSMQSQTKFELQDLDAREEARISESLVREQETQRRNEQHYKCLNRVRIKPSEQNAGFRSRRGEEELGTHAKLGCRTNE